MDWHVRLLVTKNQFPQTTINNAHIILGILRKHIYERPPLVPYTMNLTQIAEDIDNALQPSFSDLVIRSGEAEYGCPTCKQTHRIYRLRWREEYIPVLKMLTRPMTTSEIGSHFKGQTARKAPSELVHFGLVEICGKRGGNALYRLTIAARQFLSGDLSVPESAWPPNAPSQCENGRRKFLFEMIGEDHTDKLVHVQNSVPSLL